MTKGKGGTKQQGAHLDVPLGGGEQGAHRVHVDATLDEARARTLQLVESVVVCRIHDACAYNSVRWFYNTINIFLDLISRSA